MTVSLLASQPANPAGWLTLPGRHVLGIERFQQGQGFLYKCREHSAQPAFRPSQLADIAKPARLQHCKLSVCQLFLYPTQLLRAFTSLTRSSPCQGSRFGRLRVFNCLCSWTWKTEVGIRCVFVLPGILNFALCCDRENMGVQSLRKIIKGSSASLDQKEGYEKQK